MPKEKPTNVSIADATGRCIGKGRMADDWKVIHSPKILLRFCYYTEKPEETIGQLENLIKGKKEKTPVSAFIGDFKYRDLLIDDCGFSINELDGSGSPVLNRIMLQLESGSVTKKADMQKIYQ